MSSVTAVIKARNEAYRLGRAIEAAQLLADEVLVVDDNSDDGTADVARSYGARVILARSEGGQIDRLDLLGIRAARSEWIVRIDADEIMTPTLAAELRRLSQREDVAGVRFSRKNYMFGDWPRKGGWFVADQLRFFRRLCVDESWTAGIHSQVPVRGNVVRLPLDERYATDHFDYDTVAQFVERSLLRYARTDAEERFLAGERFSPWRLAFAVPRMVLGRFVMRQGFRDGSRGLLLAVLLGVYRAVIEAHLWDIARRASLGGTQ